MKPVIKAIAVGMLLLPLGITVFAEDKTPSGMQNKKGMMGGMSEAEKDQRMRDMQEQMLKIHDLSNQILAEKDPFKKQKLKDEQLQLMKAHKASMMGKHKSMMQKQSK